MAAPHAFLDILANAHVRDAYLAGRITLILSLDLKTVLWANGAGARFMGHLTVAESLEAHGEFDQESCQQIETSIQTGTAVPIASGNHVQNFLANKINIVPWGEVVFLRSVAAAVSRNGLVDLTEGLSDDTSEAALLDLSGQVMYADKSFNPSISKEPALRPLLKEAFEDGCVKKRFLGAENPYPVGVLLLNKEPPVFLMIAARQEPNQTDTEDETEKVVADMRDEQEDKNAHDRSLSQQEKQAFSTIAESLRHTVTGRISSPDIRRAPSQKKVDNANMQSSSVQPEQKQSLSVEGQNTGEQPLGNAHHGQNYANSENVNNASSSSILGENNDVERTEKTYTQQNTEQLQTPKTLKQQSESLQTYAQNQAAQRQENLNANTTAQDTEKKANDQVDIFAELAASIHKRINDTNTDKAQPSGDNDRQSNTVNTTSSDFIQRNTPTDDHTERRNNYDTFRHTPQQEYHSVKPQLQAQAQPQVQEQTQTNTQMQPQTTARFEGNSSLDATNTQEQLRHKQPQQSGDNEFNHNVENAQKQGQSNSYYQNANSLALGRANEAGSSTTEPGIAGFDAKLNPARASQTQADTSANVAAANKEPATASDYTIEDAQNTAAAHMSAQAKKIRLLKEDIKLLDYQKDRLSFLLNVISEAVLILDPVGHVRSGNAAAAQLFGYNLENLTGKDLAALFTSSTVNILRTELSEAQQAQKGSFLSAGHEVDGYTAKGDNLKLRLNFGCLEKGDSYFLLLRDMTRYHDIISTLLRKNNEEAQAYERQSRYLALVSHEIRTPLNAILGMAQFMATEQGGPVENAKYQEYLNDMVHAGSHMMTLVNDILQMSKGKADWLKMDRKSMSIFEVLNDALALMIPQANNANIIIRSGVSADLPNVFADARAVKQILLNLMSNAINFTPPGGQIILSAEEWSENGRPVGQAAYNNGTGSKENINDQSRYILMRITDTGVGMSEDEVQRAQHDPLDTNAQSSGSGNGQNIHADSNGIKRRGQGAGLGLPMVRTLAEANNIKFSLSSKPGKGTTVGLLFPLNEEKK